LHGSNPHGEGTVGVVDADPDNATPLPGDPAAGSEEVVLGDSRGEQNGGAYHGHVSLVHLNLTHLIIPLPVNQDFLPIDTGPGQNAHSAPLAAELTAACNATTTAGLPVCVNVLTMDSSTSNTGSSNQFQALNANALPGNPVHADAGSSTGTISEGGGCQTATGSSSVANASVTAAPGVGVTAAALPASSSSTACQGGNQSTSNSSSVLTLNQNAVPVPAPGCGNGTADTPFTPLAPILAAVCNADDTNGTGEATTQVGGPYGVREALTLFGLTFPVTGLLPVKVALSGPESHAVAPTATPGPAAGNPAGNAGGGQGTKGQVGSGGDEGAGSAASGAQPGGGSLAFTGQNLLLLGLIGAALISVGLFTNAARQRRVV
jgi:hypothetical protein